MLKKSYLIVLLAVTVRLSALPLGNPLDTGWLNEGVVWEGHQGTLCDPCFRWCEAWSIRSGFYGDYVFNRSLRVSDDSHRATIRTTRIMTNAGYWVFNLWDRADIFGTLGGTKIRLETPGSAFFLSDTFNNSTIKFETEWYFSWSIGARAMLWECGCFGIGAEGQYFSTRPHINYFEQIGSDPFYLENGRINYQDYQFGIGATYAIPIAGCETCVVPYGGIKWGCGRIKLGDFRIEQPQEFEEITTYELFNLVSQRTMGFALGTTLVGSRKWSFTAEVRFRDELALHVNSQVRF